MVPFLAGDDTEKSDFGGYVEMIQAKPTIFNGRQFRLRMEARWAVFFDFLHIEYLYEPAWDAVKVGWAYVNYKPDYFLPAPLALWVEIKPRHIDNLSYLEMLKTIGWTKEYGSILILVGQPQVPKTNSQEHYLVEDRKGKLVVTDHMWWCECPKCGTLGVEHYGGIPAACSTSHYTEEITDLFDNVLPDPDGHKSQRIKRAYKAARDEKF